MAFTGGTSFPPNSHQIIYYYLQANELTDAAGMMKIKITNKRKCHFGYTKFSYKIHNRVNHQNHQPWNRTVIEGKKYHRNQIQNLQGVKNYLWSQCEHNVIRG